MNAATDMKALRQLIDAVKTANTNEERAEAQNNLDAYTALLTKAYNA